MSDAVESLMDIKKPFKFSRSVDFEGQQYTEINLTGLDSLTGRDMSQVKSEWALSGKFSPQPAMDMDFCVMLACRAAGINNEFANYWPAKDYAAIAARVSNFLLT